MRLGNKIYIRFFLLLFAFAIITGCYKFEGDQTTPAYICINSISLDTYYPEQGANTADLVDVWVYLDDVLIGIYEFKNGDSTSAIFPVLAEGKHKLEIRGGIKINGISSTRAPYPFYNPITYDEFDFIPGTIQSLGNLTTSYLSTTVFAWLEDFEQADITMTKIDVCSSCDTTINKTSPANNPIAFLSSNSKYSGIINLTEERNEFGATSYNSFDVPTAGTYSFLEMDYKTDNYLSISILVRDQYEFVERQLLILNHTDEWKKIYINLGSNLSLFPLASDYSIVFRAGLEDENSSAQILLDNIKVVHR